MNLLYKYTQKYKLFNNFTSIPTSRVLQCMHTRQLKVMNTVRKSLKTCTHINKLLNTIAHLMIELIYNCTTQSQNTRACECMCTHTHTHTHTHIHTHAHTHTLTKSYTHTRFSNCLKRDQETEVTLSISLSAWHNSC